MLGGKEHLKEIAHLQEIQAIMKELHPRVELLMRFDSEADVVAELCRFSDSAEVSQFLLKNLSLLSVEQASALSNQQPCNLLIKALKTNVPQQL